MCVCMYVYACVSMYICMYMVYMRYFLAEGIWKYDDSDDGKKNNDSSLWLRLMI